MESERNALGTALVPEIGAMPMDRFAVLQPKHMVKPGINVTEHLQQLLARATRTRPGTGQKRPLIWDLANHPDDVCAAVSRFWAETRQDPKELWNSRRYAI